MKKYIFIFVMILLEAGLFNFAGLAHPGTGIIVDKYGNVYFIYTGVGVAKISPGGKLTYIYKEATGGHWMCLDEHGIFAQTQPKYFKRITPVGIKPAIIYASGGSPVVVNRDGNFYYCGGQNGDMNPGAKTLVRGNTGETTNTF